MLINFLILHFNISLFCFFVYQIQAKSWYRVWKLCTTSVCNFRLGIDKGTSHISNTKCSKGLNWKLIEFYKEKIRKPKWNFRPLDRKFDIIEVLKDLCVKTFKHFNMVSEFLFERSSAYLLKSGIEQISCALFIWYLLNSGSFSVTLKLCYSKRTRFDFVCYIKV